MAGIDLGALLPALTKSGVATILLALLIGASYLVREWRGGSMSVAKEEDLNKRLEDVETRLSAAEKRIGQLQNQLYDMRAQRDRARIYAEALEMRYAHDPRIVWPLDAAEGD